MAKTYKNLYPQIYDFANLHAAYLAARKGKRYRPDVLKFSQNLEPSLIQLQNELVWETYKTGRYREFYVYEPKKRIVAALPFRDRVVQHAIIAVVEPIWERRFIYDSYACRPGKGTHAGADRAQEFIRRIGRRNSGIYALKADVSKYFASIDHFVLRQLLGKRIGCDKTMALLCEIIDSTPGGVGIPIGNLTSQLFANIYLHELDEFVKYDLKERHYIRYMDDFVVIHPDKAYLQGLRGKIEAFLWDRLRLQTNDKTQVFPVATKQGRGLDFLGYKIWSTHRTVRKDSIKRMTYKLHKLQRQYAAGEIDLRRIKSSIISWISHAKHADSFVLRTKLLAKITFKKNINW